MMMASLLIEWSTYIASVYTLFLIVYGLNIYWNMYLPMFIEELLDKVCRPFVSLFKDVRIGNYSLALVTAMVVVFFINLVFVSFIRLIF
jgi:colicin V production protein